MNTRKVYSAWQRKTSVPQIKLQGRWLHAAGLSIGAPIHVQVEQGRLVITTSTATP
jgi:type I toxin-antitoxin system toxin SymE